MILIGLGANLPSKHGGPVETLKMALDALAEEDASVVRRSGWYESAPVPASDQPWYVNGVAEVRTTLSPERLLEALHRIEAAFGRVRSERNAARAIDIDLLDYDGQVRGLAGEGPVLPHPRLHERLFVLLPLRDVAPAWRHPVTNRSIDEMLATVDPAQVTRPIVERS